ncbi:glycine zipper 2TM domain-containing protein [Chitinilyticum litopenaei]|uniref:glycine zipper 2TM domain-containing protein n=1 Tax=Chitinilyticum litopenaei TaxID=1121276 RepID=UPI0003FA1207|nr:glycine zipper 2TM domain-containing protein [Chitinilyticum litopenaei]
MARLVHGCLFGCLAVLLGPLAWAGDLPAQRERIESDYRLEVAICHEFASADQPACLQDAKTQRQLAYQRWWTARDRNAAVAGYDGDLPAQKLQIESQYQLLLGMCRELDKASQAACRGEAISRKKAELKRAMTRPADTGCRECGVVSRVQEIERRGEGPWLGRIGGAAAGGMLGSKIGEGSGRTLAIILGTLGGALLGAELDRQLAVEKAWEVTVLFEDGREESVVLEEADHGFAQGDPVRLENGQLLRR